MSVSHSIEQGMRTSSVIADSRFRCAGVRRKGEK